MDKSQVDEWLARYVEAWKTYERDAILALFGDEAEYRYHAYDEPVRGRDAIADAWLSERDVVGRYDGSYETVAVDGEVAVAVGTSTYLAADGSVDRVYENVFVMRFDPDGRCRSFTEWYVKRPARTG